ncbi:Centromere protein X [Vigna unguiculata]|uniref:Centromere protein X n=1 Tax=Vigna unguiculata TaxID=3917 RepID=A0A4D6KW47_VIGUN|nr:Centromere protein X [Vigna unguiculata]
MLKLTTLRIPSYSLELHDIPCFTVAFGLLLQVGVGTSKKNRTTSANGNALKLTCELLRLFITEAVQRAAAVAEAEGANQIEPTHLEIILPQLLLDF